MQRSSSGNSALSDEPLHSPGFHSSREKVDETKSTRAGSAKIWIPKEHSNRTLVLCFDGTGDHFDSDNSNVVQLAAMLRKDDTSQQLVYYQPGIGTYTGTTLPIISDISMTLDEMFATSLSTHVLQGYTFLMQNYTDGDKVCLFGFSRGAYTARALAGMLHKVGLLPRSNGAQLRFAYDMYANTATDVTAADFDEQVELVETFKRTFCRELKVDFLGVWDTVASVGLFPRTLPFVYMNNGVRYLRHALSLDERRVRFLPSFASAHTARQHSNPGTAPLDPLKLYANTPGAAQERFDATVNAPKEVCDVREVWFAGVHADVGGGSVHNRTPHALARIPLRWMVREAFRCNTGIMFDAAMLQQIGLSLRTTPDGTLALADVPARLDAADARDIVGLQLAEDTGGAGGGWTAPFRGVHAFLRGVLGLVVAPLLGVLEALGVWRRLARYGWISPSARGRYVPPSRAHPVHAKKMHDVHPAKHPHAVDAAKCAEHDPGYEAREELKDALSPMFDQLGACSGWRRLLWLAMEYTPTRVRVRRAFGLHTDGEEGADADEWWSTRGRRSVWEWLLNRGRGRPVSTHEVAVGLQVHRSVKTRLEARGVGLAHPLSQAGEDTHVRVDGAEVYVPQMRPQLPGRPKATPRRLEHREWNVDVPIYWQWVD